MKLYVCTAVLFVGADVRYWRIKARPQLPAKMIESPGQAIGLFSCLG